VKLLGTGSAFVSPAWGALDMVESIAFDKRKIIPTCVLLDGEYGVKGLFIGVPAILGKNGVEKVIEMELTAAEKEAFKNSVAAVQKTVDEVNAMS
jgi:malate dehydrogenase